MATTIASTAPISANHPDSTALWASLSRIVNHPPGNHPPETKARNFY